MSAAAPSSSDHTTTDPSTLVRDAAERLGPSVVGLGRGWHAGSGVVVAPGRVLTVAHAIAREEVSVKFADGRRADAKVLAIDGDADLAVLETDTATRRRSRPPTPATPASAARSSRSPIPAAAACA
jgi:S1-C subfamily serine protease